MLPDAQSVRDELLAAKIELRVAELRLRAALQFARLARSDAEAAVAAVAADGRNRARP
jgi:hypothetical protein